MRGLSHLSKERRLTIREQRKLDGLCTQCGDPVSNDLRNTRTGKLKKMCRVCLRKNADKLEGHRRRRAAAGMCERCGKNPPILGLKNCEACKDYCREARRIRAKASFFDLRARSGRLQYSIVRAKTLWSLWKEQRGLCALTGIRLTRENAWIDHIIPVSKGGSNERDNLRWVIQAVNQAKSTLVDSDFFDLCNRVLEYQKKKGIQWIF